MRPRYQTEIAGRFQGFLEILFCQIRLAHVARYHGQPEEGTLAFGIYFLDNLLVSQLRLAVSTFVKKVVALIEQPLFLGLCSGRDCLDGRSGRRGKRNLGKPALLFNRVNPLDHWLVEDAHGGLLLLKGRQRLVEVTDQDQTRRRHLLQTFLGFRLWTLVEAQFRSPDQTLCDQEWKILFERRGQSGRAVGDSAQLGLFIDLRGVSGGERVQEKVQVLVTDFVYLRPPGGRNHQIVIHSVNPRLHLLRRP